MRTVNDETVRRATDDHPRFAVAAKRLVRFTGSGWAVGTTAALVALWLIAGFAADFGRPWELIMTAGVPILTLLLLIVVQHTQNHDNLAMQLKLDELIRALQGSHEEMIRIEDTDAEHLGELERAFKAHVEETAAGSTSS
jgi:low affinity Fe/Cu permease